MEVKHLTVKIRELVEGFKDLKEEGVTGCGGSLNIRPAFQREFVYPVSAQKAVIDSIMKGFPINTFYWGSVVGGHEIIDGQQRTMSICNFCNNDFAIETSGLTYFHSLTQEEKKKLLDYEITVYVCDGTEREKLDWFNIVNTGGVLLTKQELRNACYTGKWLTDAKKHFSRINCAAMVVGQVAGNTVIKGSPDRQEILEKVLLWFADSRGIDTKNKDNAIGQVMSEFRHQDNASELWEYFRSVMDFVKQVFIKHRKEMVGLDFGLMYNKHKGQTFDPIAIEQKVAALLQDEDVTKKSGVFEFVLGGNEKLLSIRAFSDKVRREVFEAQGGVCPICGENFAINEMQADHITAWSKGGKTTSDNCQMLCKKCNLGKSNKF